MFWNLAWKDAILVDAPTVSFASSEEMDVAFLLNSLSPKFLIHRFRQDAPRELDGLAREYEWFAEKLGSAFAT